MNGRVIASKRKLHGITQQDLADYLGVTRTTVHNYESGRSNPSMKMAKKIADHLKFDINELFT